MRAARWIAPDVGYVALLARAFNLAQDRFARRITGTVFEGAPSIGFSIEELLSAETVAAKTAHP